MAGRLDTSLLNDWIIVYLYLRICGREYKGWLTDIGPQWAFAPGIIIIIIIIIIIP